ncbi:MAG: hypothetical protein ACLSVD_09120 [Eggerthellaceae bacterium]
MTLAEDPVYELGDVVIAPTWPAQTRDSAPEEEISLLLVHGLLHLSATITSKMTKPRSWKRRPRSSKPGQALRSGGLDCMNATGAMGEAIAKENPSPEDGAADSVSSSATVLTRIRAPGSRSDAFSCAWEASSHCAHAAQHEDTFRGGRRAGAAQPRSASTRRRGRPSPSASRSCWPPNA